MTPQTRLIVLTNLHNPTGALIDDATLRRGRRNRQEAQCTRAGGRSLSGGDVRAAAAAGDSSRRHFLVTSSLTKAYGSERAALRMGIGAPELAERMWHINDLYGVNAAHPAELMSVIALDNLDRVADRAKKLLAANRPALDAFLQSIARTSSTFSRSTAPSHSLSCCAEAWMIWIACCERNTRRASFRAATSTCRSISASASEAIRR